MHRHWFRGGTILAAVLVAALENPTSAQAPATPYSLRMTRAVAERVITAWNDELAYVPGDVLVKFRPGTSAAAQARVLSVMRAPVDATGTRWIGNVLLARTPGEPDAEVAAAVLARQPEVEWAQPNYLLRPNAAPNDPAYSRQWNLDLIEMPRAWDINPGANPEVRVAVIDTGATTVSATYVFTLWTGSQFEQIGVPVAVNPDIAAARTDPGYDFVFWDGPVVDFDGHGTHVAGTALQETNNSLGLAGIAYGARLVPLKVCIGYWELQFVQSALGIPGFVDPEETGFCPTAEVAAAIRQAADSGVEVINLSLGTTFPLPAVLEALQYAVGKGVFVAISAGNGFESGNVAEYPASYAAQINGAASVGAVGRSQRRAYYSNTGAYVELAAPGGDIRDGGLPGTVYQVGLFFNDYNPATVIRPRFDRYAEVPFQGTSMAAPHVAGVAALLHSQGIRNPAAIEAALRRFARDLGTAGRDSEYGDGLVDARAALRGLGVGR